MDTWFRIEINGVSGYMRLTNGEFAGYYDEVGSVILPHEGTSVHVTENDVAGPT